MKQTNKKLLKQDMTDWAVNKCLQQKSRETKGKKKTHEQPLFLIQLWD